MKKDPFQMYKERILRPMATIGLGPCVFEGLTLDQAMDCVKIAMKATRVAHHVDAGQKLEKSSAVNSEIDNHFPQKNLQNTIQDLMERSKNLANSLPTIVRFNKDSHFGFYVTENEGHNRLVRVGIYPDFHVGMTDEKAAEWLLTIVRRLISLHNDNKTNNPERAKDRAWLHTLARQNAKNGQLVQKLKAGTSKSLESPKLLVFKTALVKETSKVSIKTIRPKKVGSFSRLKKKRSL